MELTAVKKVPKARWRYLLPVFFLVNFFGFMDRQVISMALPGGMAKDLAMNATLAGFASGIFAIGALFLQIHAGQTAQKGKVKSFVAVCIIAWSICSILTGFVQSSWQLLSVRFLLGLAEGALSPAVVTLITFWFPDRNGERNRAISAFFTAVSTAAVLTGPIGGMIIAFSNWRILYIILGIISFLTGILWIVFISERPEDAKWLSEEERNYIVSAIKEERDAVKRENNIKVSGDKLPLAALLKNKYVWALCLIGFCVNLGQFGFSMWMPTMIQTVTKAGILGVGFISMLPSIAAIIGLWTWSFIANKTKDRRLTTGTPLLFFGVFLVLGTIITGNAVIAIGMMCLTGFFLQAHMPSFYTLPSLLLIKELDGPARGMIGVGMGLGAFAGPYIVGYLITLIGSTNAGMYILAAVLAIGFLVSFMLPKNLGSKDIPSENTTNLKLNITK